MAYLNEKIEQQAEQIKAEFPDHNLSDTDAENLALSLKTETDMGLDDDDEYWNLIDNE